LRFIRQIGRRAFTKQNVSDARNAANVLPNPSARSRACLSD
jgi:hypothetical protein